MNFFQFSLDREITVDDLTKLVPLVLLGVYGSGYLVLSLHLSQYGIIQESPLRPRILAAGVLLVVLTGVAMMAGLAVHAIPARGLSFTRIFVIRILAVPFACHLLSLPGWLFWNTSRHSAGASPHIPIDWHLVWVGIFLATYGLPIVARWQYKERWKAAALALVISDLGAVIFSRLPSSSSPLFLWNMGIALLSLIMVTTGDFGRANPTSSSLNDDSAHSFTKVTSTYASVSWVTGVLALLSLFSVFVYKTLPASVGGGKPVLVGLAIKPDEKTGMASTPKSGAYYLLDQSDQGVYITDPKDEDDVLFVPKERIDEILFAR